MDNNKKILIKNPLVILTTIFLITIIDVFFFFSTKQEQKIETQKIEKNEIIIKDKKNNPIETSQLKPKLINQTKQTDSKIDNKTTSTPAQETNTVSVSLTVLDKTYKETVSASSTIYDFMKLLADTGQINIVFKNYGQGLGYMAYSIDGVTSSQTQHKFWIYYINGQKAQIGISNYHLQNGDNIVWKYENEE